jgi:hypothetical protein
MCNCGKKRSAFSRTGYFNNNKNSVSAVVEGPAPGPDTVRFQYIGRTALTVIGNVTSIRYRFDYPGDIQNIDIQDMREFMALHLVKKVD